MSKQGSVYRRVRLQAAAWVICLASAAFAQPHAITPIPIPRFSIDQASPTIGGAITAAAVLERPGPTVAFSGSGLGLGLPGDELDELSGSRTDITAGDTFVILFGVDRATVGDKDPDASLLPDRPYNVKDQAAKRQAAADTFMTLDGYTRTGGPIPTARAVAQRNNTLVVNQCDSGGIDYNLEPCLSAFFESPAGAATDDSDATYYDTPLAAMRAVTTNMRLFFTATRTSPSLNTLPGIPSGANVYFDSDPTVPGNEQLYADAQNLGLQFGPSGDDIDGLAVFDENNNGVLDIGLDQVLFSLAPDSPSLGPMRSPADLFTSNGNGTFTIFARADDLGLLPSDNVDNLELLKTTDPAATVFESAIFLVIPCDYDHNGVLDSVDCNAFVTCFGGPVGGPCAVFDQDFDGDIDCADWLLFRQAYQRLNGGAVCPVLTVDQFVAALLMMPQLPPHACTADMNGDGVADGRDVGPYILAYLVQ